jgi:hypothetical protein
LAGVAAAVEDGWVTRAVSLREEWHALSGRATRFSFL